MGLTKLIDLDLLDRFLGKVKALIPTKTSDLTNDSGFMSGMTVLSYGSSTWNDFIAAYNANKVVYCKASSEANPATGSQTRLAFMAYVNNTETPTEVEFQYYRSVSSHSNTQQGDQVYVYKLNSSTGWSVTTRENYTKIVPGTNMSGSYSNGVLTLSTAPQIVNENLLDNWYFVGGGSQLGHGVFPINRRGAASYSYTVGYCYDRWLTRRSGGTVQLSSSGVVVTNGSDGRNWVMQVLDIEKYRTKTITISALTSDGLISESCILPATNPSSETSYANVSSGNTRIFINIVPSSNKTYMNVGCSSTTSGSTVTIYAVKLEIGNNQTLAHQENGVWVLNEIPNYEEQLTRCNVSHADPDDTYANKTLSYDLPNSNLITNGYFVGGGSQLGWGNLPINQRGLTTYTSSGVSLDLWATGGTVTLNSDCVNWNTGQTASYIQFKHTLQPLRAGRYTLSMLANVKSLGGTVWFCFRDEMYHVESQYAFTSATNNYQLYSITRDFSSDVSGWSVGMVTNNAASDYINIDIKAIKLELGDTQTLAHKVGNSWILNEVPNFDEQLIRCKTNAAMDISTDPYTNKIVAYAPVVKSVTLSSANWSGSGPYTQTVTISGYVVTSKTKVDLQPDSTVLAAMVSAKINALYIENNSGTLTAYAIGASFSSNVTVQVTCYETA